MNNPYDVWCRDCGCVMRIRNGKFGKFYGCTGYPVCKNTMNLRDAELSITEQLGAGGPSGDWDGYGAGGDYDPGGDFD